MDANARAELNSIKRELNSIISELESISNGVRNDFVGIGNVQCSDAINRVLNSYYSVRWSLNNLDTNTVTESFGSSHGGGFR